jgi:tRNA dimethylallyltransferase
MAQLLVIVGPTAVGKSEVALAVAERLKGEIVSADSVQVYRYLNIGAAKPSPSERAAVPHHLLDLVNPGEDFTVADFQREARRAIAQIRGRGHLPVLVGGSGLYVRAVVHNYAFSPSGRDETIRRRLMREAQVSGTEPLYRRLAAVDPGTAEKLHPNDLRRVIRALEAYEQGTRPLSLQSAGTTGPDPGEKVFMFGLTMPRGLLYRRIEARVDKMLELGLVEEVKSLLARGCGRDSKAMLSLGYRQIVGYLSGELSLEEAAALIKRDTRRFAKRQLTWFRRDKETIWLDICATGGPAAAAEKICCELAGYYYSGENT